MQDHAKTCAIVDEFFSSNNITSVIKSYLSPRFWVATFNRYSEQEPSKCLGIFSAEKSAVQSALNFVGWHKYIVPVLNDVCETISCVKDFNSYCQEYGHLELWEVVFSFEELDIGYD